MGSELAAEDDQGVGVAFEGSGSVGIAPVCYGIASDDAGQFGGQFAVTNWCCSMNGQGGSTCVLVDCWQVPLLPFRFPG